jgi:hypothetical protein
MNNKRNRAHISIYLCNSINISSIESEIRRRRWVHQVSFLSLSLVMLCRVLLLLCCCVSVLMAPLHTALLFRLMMPFIAFSPFFFSLFSLYTQFFVSPFLVSHHLPFFYVIQSTAAANSSAGALYTTLVFFLIYKSHQQWHDQYYSLSLSHSHSPHSIELCSALKILGVLCICVGLAGSSQERESPTPSKEGAAHLPFGFSTLLSASVSTFFFLYIYILFSRGCISKGWAYRQPKHQEREKKFLLFLILFFFLFLGGFIMTPVAKRIKCLAILLLCDTEKRKKREREKASLDI